MDHGGPEGKRGTDRPSRGSYGNFQISPVPRVIFSEVKQPHSSLGIDHLLGAEKLH